MEEYLQRLRSFLSAPNVSALDVRDGMIANYLVISRLNQIQGDPEVGLKHDEGGLYQHIAGFMSAIFWERGFNFDHPTVDQMMEIKMMLDGMAQVYAMPEHLQVALNEINEFLLQRGAGQKASVSAEVKALLDNPNARIPQPQPASSRSPEPEFMAEPQPEPIPEEPLIESRPFQTEPVLDLEPDPDPDLPPLLSLQPAPDRTNLWGEESVSEKPDAGLEQVEESPLPVESDFADPFASPIPTAPAAKKKSIRKKNGAAEENADEEPKLSRKKGKPEKETPPVVADEPEETPEPRTLEPEPTGDFYHAAATISEPEALQKFDTPSESNAFPEPALPPQPAVLPGFEPAASRKGRVELSEESQKPAPRFQMLSMITGLIVGLALGTGAAWLTYHSGVKPQMEKTINMLQAQMTAVRTELSQVNRERLILKTSIDADERSWQKPPFQLAYTKTGTGMVLYWYDNVNGRKYFIYRAKGSKGKFEKIESVPAGRTFLIMNKLTRGAWSFAVTALDHNKQETQKSEALSLVFPLKR